jgi:hypothetical protein
VTKVADKRELSRLFAELRRSDEASAPSFRQVLERKMPGQAPPSRFLLIRFVAVAAVLVVAALTVALLRRPARDAAGRERPVALAQWKSSTDWLLRTQGSELLGELPTPPRSVPRYAGFEGTEKARGKTPRPGR